MEIWRAICEGKFERRLALRARELDAVCSWELPATNAFDIFHAEGAAAHGSDAAACVSGRPHDCGRETDVSAGAGGENPLRHRSNDGVGEGLNC
jgi:hypothetical protein